MTIYIYNIYIYIIYIYIYIFDRITIYKYKHTLGEEKLVDKLFAYESYIYIIIYIWNVQAAKFRQTFLHRMCVDRLVL